MAQGVAPLTILLIDLDDEPVYHAHTGERIPENDGPRIWDTQPRVHLDRFVTNMTAPADGGNVPSPFLALWTWEGYYIIDGRGRVAFQSVDLDGLAMWWAKNSLEDKHAPALGRAPHYYSVAWCREFVSIAHDPNESLFEEIGEVLTRIAGPPAAVPAPEGSS